LGRTMRGIAMQIAGVFNRDIDHYEM
jgi:hypothetical protein